MRAHPRGSAQNELAPLAGEPAVGQDAVAKMRDWSSMAAGAFAGYTLGVPFFSSCCCKCAASYDRLLSLCSLLLVLVFDHCDGLTRIVSLAYVRSPNQVKGILD